ncbi:alcohol dehydrogenase catalytic domain-containing protein [Streptomyces sp. L7]
MLGCVIHGQDDLRVEELTIPEPGPGQALVAVRYGGVCGSDLHYWRHGGVGDFRLKEPMLLGHEVVGTVVLRPRRLRSRPGTAVAVHPATPCGVCPECADGRRNVCRDTAYLGSAARFPARTGRLRGPSHRPRRPVEAGPGGPGAAPGRPRRTALRRAARRTPGRGRDRTPCAGHRRGPDRLSGRRGGEGGRRGTRHGHRSPSGGAELRHRGRCRRRRTGR